MCDPKTKLFPLSECLKRRDYDLTPRLRAARDFRAGSVFWTCATRISHNSTQIPSYHIYQQLESNTQQ